MSIVHDTHVLYQPSDFTVAEIRRNAVLAEAVALEGKSICMRCGTDDGRGLELPCKAAACPKCHTGSGPCYCGKEGE